MGDDMRRGLSRRRFLAVAGVAAGATLAGCGSERDKMIKAAAIVSVMVGERVVRLPHPALRVLGVTLFLAGKLAVTYLALDDGSEHTEEVKLTKDEARRLEAGRQAAFVRGDNKIEERAIDDVKSGES